jgi:hypothetical protein
LVQGHLFLTAEVPSFFTPRILSATLLVSVSQVVLTFNPQGKMQNDLIVFDPFVDFFTFRHVCCPAVPSPQMITTGYSSCSLGLPDANGNRNLFTLTLVIPEEDAEALTGTAQLAPAIIQGFQVGAP